MRNHLAEPSSARPGKPLMGWRGMGRALSALGCLLGGMTVASSAKAVLVERIVAVVGDQAILQTDLMARAAPYMARIQQELATESQRAASTTQLKKSLLGQLIDEELIARAARKARVVVTDREVDQALVRVAQQNGITMERLLGEIAAAGLTEAKYREELRRQILDARVLSMRVATRVQVREEDLRAAYRAMLLDERKQLAVEPAIIVLGQENPANRELAGKLVLRARAGEDFGALARQYSADAHSRAAGGSLGRVEPGKLPPWLDQAAQKLDVGEVSEPLPLGNHWVVVKVVGRDPTKLPSLEEARAELSERVYAEKMAKARRRWLDGMRKQARVQDRL